MNREDWLSAVAEKMAPWFADRGHPLPAVRMAVGFTSKGMRSNRIGECWSDVCSGDGVHEIFITPQIDDPMRVAGILAHELVHAAVGLEAKHGRKFKKVATAIGLEGKMTATTEGEAFKRAAAPILEAVGPLPHKSLSASAKSSGPKKQTTRLLKCACSECGYTVRVTAKWLETAGAPICPTDGVPMDTDE
jgi:hypothetical protein